VDVVKIIDRMIERKRKLIEMPGRHPVYDYGRFDDMAAFRHGYIRALRELKEKLDGDKT